ncbi:hydroxyacylglutathione hydrolase [Paralimibaculum aggregatum]|uniref:Hydroxyacylglutathione hydrolase n=1 Tax=Paralimibaculum aggregatum TaxID=3036245 RepID=A0ABQ6LCJ3_9RHOB|nr:hydroxyacylglutathione hydrolase [Limibaculum sp. NKW23]GMG81094.1 hydroxyacylglutathione hydrolase [Limibaculum sp. NKW23]
MPLEIVTVPCRSDNYAYLLRDGASGKVALVDAPEERPIMEALEARGWELDAIWITHHHGDHVEAVEPLRTRFGAAVVGHGADAARLPRLDTAVGEGDTVSLGETAARVLDVSGHTVGHIAFVVDETGAGPAAFTADSLMALGCGRVFEGTHAMMWESLCKLNALPAETRIYSGHNYGKANGRFALSIEPENAELLARIERIAVADGEGAPIVPATLAEERATNPFLRAVEPGVKAALGLDGADDAAVFGEIRRRKDSF